MKIKAAVLHEMGLDRPYSDTKPVKIEELDLDGPREGEVLVRVAAAGICHSDLSVLEGVRPRPLPMALGHEGSGVVEDVGPGIDDLVRGDHVVFVFMPACGVCKPCLEGRPAICEPGLAANVAGTLLGGGRRLHRNGDYIYHQVGVSCFAEAAVTSRRSLVKIDPELPLDHAALFSCAVITGVGSVINSANVPAGSSVAVVGLGGTGLAALLGAKSVGASRIVGLDTLPHKLKLGRDFGADDVFDAGADNVIEQVRDATYGGVDYAFECVGRVEAMELAYSITRRGGTTVTSGLSHPEHKIQIPHLSMVAEERTLKGSYLGSCVPERDIPHYIELFQQGKLPVDALISSKIALNDINEGFDALADGKVVRQIITF
ncbi:MAG: zinc-dependent alcohol dehydrogenase family protein [Rhodospirillales bacterium]